MADKPVVHGPDHRPGGFDPTPTGPWHNVSDGLGISAWNDSTNYSPGDTVTNGVFVYLCLLANTNIQPGVQVHWAWYWVIDVPLFQNGWTNQGGSYVQMRYKLVVGKPNYLNRDNGSVVTYLNNQVKIQGSVSGGDSNTTVFTLPPAYTPSDDVHIAASNDSGSFICVTVKQAGDVVEGFA